MIVQRLLVHVMPEIVSCAIVISFLFEGYSVPKCLDGSSSSSSSSSSLFEIALVHVNTKFIYFHFTKYRVQFKVIYVSHSGCKLI